MTESIFHKVVSQENSFTQLLCNLMKRDPDFLGRFLDLLDERLKRFVKPLQIQPQVRLDKCGKPDILLQTREFSMIIEIKTESHRDLENSQRLLDKSVGYQSWLDAQRSDVREAWLVYLVPANWRYRHSNEQEIKNYKQRAGEKGIRVEQIYWDDVLVLLSRENAVTMSPFAEEFRLLLTERFGPVTFETKEIKQMFTPDFPMRTVLKLNMVLNGIKEKALGRKAELSCEKYEFGFYLTSGERKMFVGYSLDLWDKNHHYPICFGIPRSTSETEEAFSQAFEEVYGKGKSPILDVDDWVMGWVPQEEFDRFDAHDAIGEIWPKLSLIWDRVKASVGRQP